MDRLQRRTDLIAAGFVFLATQIVYLLTLTLQCPFWDSGEFIATSYILGIPHPPGTPLYVLIGRVFTLLPLFPMIATRVNYLSAFSSSLAAAFTCLVTLELYRRWFPPPPAASGQSDPAGSPARSPWIGAVAGVAAGLFVAFSRTFWDNAIEAEVYAFSSFLMALSVWLILWWGRPGDRVKRTGLFLLLYYLLCLSMGIHLGTLLVLPGVLVFALLVDHRLFGSGPVAACGLAALLLLLHPGLLPILGYEIWVPLVGAVLFASIALARSWSGPGKAALTVAALAAFLFAVSQHWLPSTLIKFWVVVLALAVLVPAYQGRTWSAAGPRGLLTWCLVAAVLGMSTHLYLYIRAGLDPGINEADPHTLEALWNVLIRDQYKPPNPFEVRQASWAIQLTRHFWRYARDQYDLGPGLGWIGLFLPYGLGIIGAVGQAMREKRGFLLLLITYLITSLGLVFYLNFREHEVRDRDYFFVASFHFFAVWIGLGAAYILEEIRGWGRVDTTRKTRGTVIAVGVVALLLPAGTLRTYWWTHDRTRFAVAEDFAYNILHPLEKNAIIFTNGDNDTFPLWYLQEVERTRRDVRVVNLSLLNTSWYLKQLRDVPPKIDLGWSDREIEAAAEFSGYMAAYASGVISRDAVQAFVQAMGFGPYVRSLDEPLMTKDIAVARIVEREYGRRPLYIALTVPDHMGLESRLVQKGIVMEIEEPKGKTMRVDLDSTLNDLLHVYRFNGVLDADGHTDTTVYKDANATNLIQNYAAACLSAAQELLDQHRVDEAYQIVQRAVELSPQATAVHYSLGILERERGRLPEAEAQFQLLVNERRADASVFTLLAETQEMQGKVSEAEETLRRSLFQFPDDWESYRSLFALLWQVENRPREALGILDAWLSRHPDDSAVRRARAAYADSLAARSAGSPAPGISP
jgi:tetratricopeptide (TPR) repeat protein